MDSSWFEIFFSGITVIVAIYAYVTTRRNKILTVIQRITDRLFEIDKVVISNADLQKFVYDYVDKQTKFFDRATEHDRKYFELKGLLYMRLSLYDELVYTATKHKYLKNHLDWKAWEGYIIGNLRHPLYKEIANEGIWGKPFQDFLARNRAEIDRPHDPEIS
jgi:hypothetical protein